METEIKLAPVDAAVASQVFADELLRPHLGQYLTHVLPDDIDPDLDAVATVSEDGRKLTVSIVNRHLYESRDISIHLSESGWHIVKADIVSAADVRSYNTF